MSGRHGSANTGKGYRDDSFFCAWAGDGNNYCALNDAWGTTSNGGGSNWAAGTPVSFSSPVIAHRDVWPTACNGEAFYPMLPGMRADVIARVGPGIPNGMLEGAVRTVDNRVRLVGWVVDPDTPLPISVTVAIDGNPVATGTVGSTIVSSPFPANVSRPDVGAANPGAGPDHGFDFSVTVAPGPHTVCVYAVNAGAGINTRLGCQYL